MLTAKAANRKDLSGKPATMTHQHFRQIAEIIRTLEMYDDGIDTPPVDPTQIPAIAERFADALSGTNPCFNRERFLAACQIAR